MKIVVEKRRKSTVVLAARECLVGFVMILLEASCWFPAGKALGAEEESGGETIQDRSVRANDAGAATETAGRSLSSQYLHDPSALDEGQSLYRGLCSGCHGGSARGGKGPNLTDDRWLHGDGTDLSFGGIIEKGVPGTTMKKLGESLRKEQIAKIIAYVRSLSQRAGDSDWKPYRDGDSVAGERLFFDSKSQITCNKCHALNRRGGGIGPALDRIA